MKPILVAYGSLAIAIICEVIGTTFLMESEQFTRIGPTLTMAGLYVCSFYFLSQTLKTIPLGIAYAIWAAVGIVLTAMIGLVVFKQTLDVAAVFGIGMIIGGVLVINLFSRSLGH